MKQFFTVLKFELGNYFKNKSFMVTTFIIAILAIGAVSIPTLIPGLLPGSTALEEPLPEEEIISEESSNDLYAIYDPEKVVTEDLLAAFFPDVNWKTYDSSENLKTDVSEGTAERGFVIQTPTSYTYVVQNNSMYDHVQLLFDDLLLKNYHQSYLSQKGLTEEEIADFQQTVILSEEEVLGKDSARNYWYTYILVFVLYFLILFYGQMIAVSVTTEKSNRAIEILVTSVNPNSLIFGKVIAGAISGVIQVGIILGSAFGTYHFFREAWGYTLDFLFHVPAQVWGIYVTFGLLGYLLYAFIYGTLGALVSKTEDISKSSMFITLLYIVSFFVSIWGMNAPDSFMIKVASFIPFTSSNAMLVRVAMGSVGILEIILGFVILLISCCLVGLLAAKIFRFGTLMYGNPIKFSTAIKKIRQQN